MHKIRFILLFCLLTLVSGNSYSQKSDAIILKDGLYIKFKPADGTKIIAPNPVSASIEAGKWETPAENLQVKFNGQVYGTWKKFHTDEKGWVNDDSLANTCFYFNYKADKDCIALIEGMGNSSVYVNGSARSGSVYRDRDDYNEGDVRFDYSKIPVKLHKGGNDLVFECGRGYLKAVIHPNQQGLLFTTADLTVPDLIAGKAADTYGALPVINATENLYKGLLIKTWADGTTPEYYPVNQIHPLSIVKTPFLIKLPAQTAPGKLKINIAIVKKENLKEEILSSESIELRILNSGDTYKETFISRIDGSVQYYAVNPPENIHVKPALILSLHGAGVEAINQANAYGHKNWAYLVAPTNRRPYGFNWENWGRIDALEVLEIAKKKFTPDENRIYLTGHSMGGHGTWQIGTHYSDQFGAVSPSAGWISIWSYRIKGTPEEDSTDVRKMLVRSTKTSDTYAFATNLKGNGIYIIHGDADDNVPPSQAKSMIEILSKFHKDYVYYEQPGAGHWWDVSDEAGADCVDWRPMFDFFNHHAIPGKERIKEIDFVTANPGVSSKNNWIEIINQLKQQKLSKINIKLETSNRKFAGTTENIELLAIDPSMLSSDKPVSVLLDNQLLSGISIAEGKRIILRKENGKWNLSGLPDETNKYPARCGNIREALSHNVLFVFGTHGSKEENKWAFEKARYDAEKLWYQGNGNIEIISDDEFSLNKYKDRSVMLFGNSETNSAWSLLLKDSPVQVGGKTVKTVNAEYKGSDLACVMIRPRSDSKTASIGVISGTGLAGMKLANLAAYHNQYAGFPDIVIYNSDVIKSDEQGVKFTGYFGNDWSVEKGEFVNK